MKTTSSVAKTIAALVLFGNTAALAAPPALAPAAAPAPATAASVGTEGKEGARAASPAGEDVLLTLKVPAFSPRFSQTPVALVNDDPILLDEFVTTLAALHEAEAGGGVKKAGKKDYELVLNRLITARLILQEGVSMGLDELPDTKKVLADFSDNSLRELVKRRAVKDVKADDREVEKYYRQLVQEWRIRSVKFDRKADAEALATELAAGGDFAALADKLIDAGKAEGGKTGEFVKPKDLLPRISAALVARKPGETTPVLAIGPAFTIVKLEEIRYPEGNAAAMDEAREHALEVKRTAALNDYWKALQKRYVKQYRKVLDKLDFEAAKPGFAKLLKDKRLVAEIKGEKPITVGDLAAEMQKKFFHGVEEAVKLKKVNEGKYPTLEDMLLKRVFRMEALKEGIDKTEEFRQANRKYRDSLVFGLFVDKAVVPEIKVTNGEVEDYYNAHIADYSSPAMIKLRVLAFGRQNQAEAAIDKLRKGAEFQWLQANAEGLVAAGSPGLLEFDATPLITKNLPEQLQRAVDGAKGGDFRLYASPEGYFYAVTVVDVIPPQPSPLERERKTIAQKVFGEKVGKAMEDWGAKLRAASTVKVYLTDQGR
ncbi:MAG TPA: peptidyl-prolyl cis-trans isomerase [Geobacteraceae bacterium]